MRPRACLNLTPNLLSPPKHINCDWVWVCDTIQVETPFFLCIQGHKRGLCLQGDTFGEWMKNVTHHKWKPFSWHSIFLLNTTITPRRCKTIFSQPSIALCNPLTTTITTECYETTFCVRWPDTESTPSWYFLRNTRARTVPKWRDGFWFLLNIQKNSTRQSSFSQLNINFTVTGLSCVCKIVMSNELTVQNTCRKEN